ncbi:hypothetical protein PIB30_030228 [Stylosanthes scabra]|uniref:Uncharacterized protein n=1 Tax=Stylosanthes scabra TaxID=79078 RepID=A0ABU6VAQ9_9FABA|nr:hypothetical protein [Stylosanthes scabra]
MGNVIGANSKVEAYILGLEEAVQFMMEEVNGTQEEISIVGYYKDIIQWIKGDKATNWELSYGGRRYQTPRTFEDEKNYHFPETRRERAEMMVEYEKVPIYGGGAREVIYEEKVEAQCYHMRKR